METPKDHPAFSRLRFCVFTKRGEKKFDSNALNRLEFYMDKAAIVLYPNMM